MIKYIPKIVMMLLMVLSAACTPLPDRQKELCAYAPQGSVPFALKGDPERQLSQAILRVLQDTGEQNANTPRKRCGTRLSAQPGIDDGAIVASVSDTLGAGWQYQHEGVSAGITLHLWQTQSRFWPKQYYALAAYPDTLHDPQGNSFRPLQSLYLQNNNSTLHGAVVFGTIACAMILPFVALGFFMWRRRRRVL